MPQVKAPFRIRASIGVENGGISINWSWMEPLQGRDFFVFLNTVLVLAGFHSSKDVKYERNEIGRDGSPKIDWNRIRINQHECWLQGVNPEEAVGRIRRYLASDLVTDRFGVIFDVAT